MLNSPLLHVIYFDWWHMSVIPVPGSQAGGMLKVEFSLAHAMSSKPARTMVSPCPSYPHTLPEKGSILI